MKVKIRKEMFALIKLKIFVLRDLWLFLIGILFVSATSGAIGAFILGIATEEFLLEEEENVLIVVQPGSTTPLTGMVPEDLKLDIQKVQGVLAISPETLTFAIAQNLNDKSILVRGISTNFTILETVSLLEGSWFNPEFGEAKNIQTDGAMIGYILAEQLGLSCGDKLKLASTLTDMVIELVITGIFSSDSPSDEEVLVSLSIGKAISGKASAYVSFLRILIDTEVITKEKLSFLLDQEYTVPISLITNDPELAKNIIGTPIDVYNPQGSYVTTQKIEEGNLTVFNLKFGTYEFVATPSESQNSPILTVFVNQSFTRPFELTIGEIHCNVQLNVTYNNQSANSASILLREKFGAGKIYYSNTNDSGIAEFNNIAQNLYQIVISYREIQYSKTIKIQNSTLLNFFLENTLTLTIYNISSNLEVNGGTVNITNKTIHQEVYHAYDYQSGTKIFLDYGEYDIEYQNGDTLREKTLLVNGSIYETILVGLTQLSIIIQGENQERLASANVTITRLNETILESNADINGIYIAQLEVDVRYNVTTSPIDNQTWNQTRDIMVGVGSSIIFDFVANYKLDISVQNGTIKDEPDNLLAGCTVKIFEEETLISTKITDSSGKVSFDLIKPGVYRLSVEKSDYYFEKVLTVYYSYQSHLVQLGKLRMILKTHSITGVPISNVKISIISTTNETIAIGYTNTSGILDTQFPLGKHTVEMEINSSLFFENISFIESQIVEFVKILEISSDLTIRLINQFSQKMSKSYVKITNTYYDINLKGFTDINGEVTFYKIPFGNWKIEMAYYDEVFPSAIIDIHTSIKIISFQLESTHPILNPEEYAWRNINTFSVVLSADYVSGFLQSTLSIIITTFASLIIIISVLSLLSIASVISQPIVSNAKTLGTFKRLGASKAQVTIGVVSHLSLLGFIASILGAFFGMFIMISLPELKNVNIGGMIIRPKMDFWILVLITVSNLTVIIIKAAQKVLQFDFGEDI